MKVSKFFNAEFIEFSIYDCVRSIPSVIDGFKPSQRKCIYGSVKRGENSGEIKVAQLAAYIAQITDYHHGEGSLQSTIVGLARDYVGSNNMNFLIPSGQFGNRLSKEPAAARYIFTELSDNFRKLFKKDDDQILEHLYSDGEKIEPNYYLPILPTVLINGASGIGTGFAVDVLNYNPNDLKTYILDRLNDKMGVSKILPWYRGFRGTITDESNNKFIIRGCFERVNRNVIRITELPVDLFNENYKKHLCKLQDEGLVKEFVNNSTDEQFDYLITLTSNHTQLTDDYIYSKFKLESKFSQNLTLWDENNKIRVFEDVYEIIDHFIQFRLSKYETRRQHVLNQLQSDLDLLLERKRFIQYYIENSKTLSSKTKKELTDLLLANDFVNIDKLLEIKIYNLTVDEINKLDKTIDKTEKDLRKLEKTTAKQMYIDDLKEFTYDY